VERGVTRQASDFIASPNLDDVQSLATEAAAYRGAKSRAAGDAQVGMGLPLVGVLDHV
jgi:hypothetical protein